MRVRNWEDFVSVDQDGFIVQYDPRYEDSGIDWSAIASSLGEISATATPIPGNLDGTEQGDLIAFDLTAGVTYSFDLRGAVGGVNDPYLILLNSSLSTLVQDDDGGLGLSSLLTYTPTVTGTYYLYATSFDAITGNPAADFGDYTINAWTREADVAGSTNVLASLPTAATLGLGTYYGNIDASGDNDYFRIDVVAGQTYGFVFAGGAASNAEFSTAGNTAATLSLYTSTGALIGSNLNFESSVTYYAPTSGTIYVRAAGLTGTTGGYTLDVAQIDLSTRDPLESLNWDRAANIDTVLVDGVPTAYVYFGAAGETFGESIVAAGWTQAQIDAVMTALQTDYTPITGINYVRTTDVTQAEFRMQTTPTANYGAYFYPQDPAYGTQEGIGVFNLASGGFGSLPQSLDRGGYSYAVILHEFGHAHGVAHPHDTGGGSEIMLGVNGATGSLGVFNLNQGVYTVMSYNDAWRLHPDGPSAFTVAGIDNGWSATLGAFDIAVLQARYGQHTANTGDTVYALTDVADDAFYQTIWDTGGIDTISYGGTFNAQIDLTAATLDYSPTGGGVLSFLYNPQPPIATNSFLVRGGYTIANDVVIENASGGSGNDVLIGNEVANTLTGNGGNDTLMGRAGNDLLVAGAGNDVVSGGDGLDVIQLGGGDDIFVAEIGTTESVLKTGSMSVDIITDFDLLGDDLIDLSGLDQAFQFRGTSANRNVGDLTYKTYTSVNGAENALGFDIDGNPGASNISGPVTVVYGNIDGGEPDFAIILLNTSSVTASDFIFSDVAADAAYTANQVSSEYRAFEDSQTRMMGDLYFA
ncbi:MAG: M10 family metallopeptidase C-terminal domain-containing protein [Pseudomonadota bacterium]